MNIRNIQPAAGYKNTNQRCTGFNSEYAAELPGSGVNLVVLNIDQRYQRLYDLTFMCRWTCLPPPFTLLLGTSNSITYRSLPFARSLLRGIRFLVPLLVQKSKASSNYNKSCLIGVCILYVKKWLVTDGIWKRRKLLVEILLQAIYTIYIYLPF